MVTETRTAISRKRKNTIYSNLTTLQRPSKQALEGSSSAYQIGSLLYRNLHELSLKKEQPSSTRKCTTAIRTILQWSSTNLRLFRPRTKPEPHRLSIKLELRWNSSPMLQPKVPSWNPNCHIDKHLPLIRKLCGKANSLIATKLITRLAMLTGLWKRISNKTPCKRSSLWNLTWKGRRINSYKS